MKEAIPEKKTHLKVRTEFAEKHLNDTAGVWKNDLWSDETKIELFG